MFGNPVDPTTVESMAEHFPESSRQYVIRSGKLQYRCAGIHGPLEKDVYFAQGVNRVARWDGVNRKPPTQGAGDGVSVNFNWGAPVAATTIRISVFNTDLKLLFSGEGGMALNEAVDVRSGSGFVRRREILGNEDHVREGIALALHPLVPMAKWPGNPD